MTRIFALILLLGFAACGDDKASGVPSDGNGISSGNDSPGIAAPSSDSNVSYTGPQVAYKGRFVPSSAVDGAFDCAWSGCAVETRFTGTSVSIGLTSASNANIYFDVSIDGGAPTKLKLSSGVTSYTVLSPAPKQAHTVRWTKISEASYGSVTFTPPIASSDGALMATAAPTTRLIEFVGDSITAGYGVLGADSTCTGTAENQDADLAYPALVGAAFGADYHQLGYSKRGLAHNADCTTTGLVPSLYGYAIPPGTQNATVVEWDSTQAAPAVIVINVGTTDFSAAVNSSTCNTSSASTNPGFPDMATYESAYVTFLQTLTTIHPDAHILLVYGPMLSPNVSANTNAPTTNQVAVAKQYLEDVVASVNQGNISLVGIGPQDFATTGCNFHPNAATHAQAASVIEAAIKALPLGWTH